MRGKINTKKNNLIEFLRSNQYGSTNSEILKLSIFHPLKNDISSSYKSQLENIDNNKSLNV